MTAESLPPRQADPGYLGTTSFSATFFEDRSLAELEGATNYDIDLASQWNNWLLLASCPRQLQKGAACLALLEEFMPYEPLINLFSDEYSGTLMAGWVIPCLESLKIDIYQPMMDLAAEQREDFLVKCSSTIFHSTFKPFGTFDARCTRSDYKVLFTGKNLRWEAVGIFFCSLGIASMIWNHPQMRDHNLQIPQLPYDSSLGRRLMDASQACLSFCEEARNLTDPELWLRSENFYLCTLIEGDADYITWMRLGDLVSTCTAMGLHVETNASSSVPFWLREIRKKSFAIIYSQNICLSCFLGRPPRLTRRHCTMSPSLDLHWTEIFVPQSIFGDDVANVNFNGWRADNAATSSARHLYSLFKSMIKEDILDFSLRTIPEDDMKTARELQARFQYAWNSLSSAIREPILQNNVDTTRLRSMQLDWKYNEFLLQRVIVRRLGPDPAAYDQLMTISRTLLGSMLSLADVINGKTRGVGKLAADLPWLLAKLALPPAGVLGLELLRDTQGNGHSKGTYSSFSSALPTSSTFNRSEAVQQLSVLAATLQWGVTRHHGNFRICDQARRVILLILDRVLNYSPEPEARSEGVGGGGNAMDEVAVWWQEQDKLGLNEVSFWTSLPGHPLLR